MFNSSFYGCYNVSDVSGNILNGSRVLIYRSAYCKVCVLVPYVMQTWSSERSVLFSWECLSIYRLWTPCERSPTECLVQLRECLSIYRLGTPCERSPTECLVQLRESLSIYRLWTPCERSHTECLVHLRECLSIYRLGTSNDQNSFPNTSQLC